MARYQGGFAEGFKGGFGLVNDFNTQKAKERDAEQTQAFRQEELGLRKQTAAAAAEQDLLQTQYRQEERNFRRDNLAIDKEAQANRDDDREIEKKERLASRLADKKYQTERLAALARQDEVAKGKLTAQELAAEKVAVDELNLRNGGHFTRLSSLADSGDFASMQEYLTNFGDDIFNKKSHLHLPDLLNPDTNDNFAGLLKDFQSIAAGENLEEVSPASKAAASVMLMQNRKQFVGQRLDSSFVNAPQMYRDQGLRIIDSGVHSLNSRMTEVTDANGEKTKKPTVGAQAWVEVDRGNGNSAFYPASITKHGNQGEVTEQDMDFGQAGQGMAGMVQISQFMQKNPLIKTATEEYMKERNFGSPEKFEAFVAKELAAIYKQVEGMEKDNNLPGNLKSMGFEGTVGDALKNRQDVRAKVVQNALYGPSKRSGGERAKAFFEGVERDFPKITYDSRGGGPNRIGRKGIDSIDSLLTLGIEDLSLTQKLSIGELADDDGHISGDNVDKLLAYLGTQEKETRLPTYKTPNPLGGSGQ